MSNSTSAKDERCLLQSTSGCDIDLYNHFKKATAFLICSGPSLKEFDFTALQSRGVLTCSVNNAGAIFRSNLWVAYDHPGSFSDVIWRDPGIWKFIPTQRLDLKIRIRDQHGALIESEETARQMPATFGYKSNLEFNPADWLTENSINCGNVVDDSKRNEQVGSRSVMLVALKLLYYLGVRRLFLLGCDFRMSYSGQNYAFEQARTRQSIRMNNNTYRILIERFRILQPHFADAGFEVFNCTPNSSLTAFPFVEFEQALKTATMNMPDLTNTTGMYEQPKDT